MELIAFTHAAAAYEDSSPIPELRELPLDMSATSWAGALSATVMASAIAVAAQPVLAAGYLEYGDESVGVEVVQEALADADYFDGDVDGVYGADTEAAVSDFQAQEDLVEDGVVGEDTLYRLGLSADDVADDISYDYNETEVDLADAALQFGDSGAEVEALQEVLTDEGYYFGEIDGEFGSETEEAVIAYQEDNDIAATGVVDTDTLVALGLDDTPVASGGGGSNVFQFGNEGVDIEDIQLALTEEGYYTGSIDGVFGSATEEAVLAYQDDSGLDSDGIVGPDTLDALGLI